MEGKKVLKFHIAVISSRCMKYKYPKPQGNIQKELVGHKLQINHRLRLSDLCHMYECVLTCTLTSLKIAKLGAYAKGIYK